MTSDSQDEGKPVDDEQIGFDIEFDEQTEAFLDWVAPERMESEVQAFLARVAPDLSDDSQWWKPPLSTQIMETSAQLFSDWAGFLAPENRELADGLIRFLGECCIRRRAGMTWTNSPGSGTPLYTDFGPAAHFADSGLGCELMPLASELFEEHFGPKGVEYSIRMAGKPA